MPSNYHNYECSFSQSKTDDFFFQQSLCGKTFRLIVDSCQHLKKLNLQCVEQFFDGDVIHIIQILGKQLTTLGFSATNITNVAYSNLKNCVR